MSYDFDRFRCDVACQSKENQNVVIYDISLVTPDFKRVITYLSQKSNERVKVKIAMDFKKVAMSYGNENYILTIDDGGHQNQKIISWLKGKHISHIVPVQNDFLFVCHKEFDKDLDIESSKREEFKIKINRQIEPGKLRVMDVGQMRLNEEGFGDKLAILNMRDENFYYDEVNPQAMLSNLDDTKSDMTVLV